MQGHRIQLIGYLGREPEMKYTPDGTPVTDFSVATSRKWTGADGSQQEQTTWFRATAWRKLAEVCNQYLSKGRQVYVEGRLNANEFGSPRVWTTNEGEPRASFEITVESIQFLGNGNAAPAPAPVAEQDEIPF